MLSFIIGIPLYIFTGYSFGKILNTEYCNNTHTEDLNILKKLKRLFLFPISYHNWKNRYQIHRFDTLRGKCTSGEKDPEKLKNYCKLLMVAWPLNAIFSIFSTLLTTIIFTCSNLSELSYTLINDSYNLANKRVRGLACKARQFLPVNTLSYVRELEQFKDIEIQESKTKLLIQRKTTQVRVEKIKEVLEEWHASPVTENSCEIIKDTTSALEKELGEETTKLKEIDSTLSNLKQHEDSIEDALKKIKLSLKTSKLGVQIINKADTGFIKGDALGELISQLISSTQTSMQICRGMHIEKIG